MVALVAEPLADLAHREPRDADEAVDLLLVGELAEQETVLQSGELLLRLLALVEVGVEEGVDGRPGAGRAARRGGRGRFGRGGRRVLHFEGGGVAGGGVGVVCARAVSAAAPLSFAVTFRRFGVCGALGLRGYFALARFDAAVAGFADIGALGVCVAGSVAVALVIAVCISTSVFTTDTAHPAISMITASKTKVDDTRLTAANDAACGPGPAPAAITVADDAAPCAAAAAAHSPHHHAHTFVGHQGRSRPRLHHGPGRRLRLRRDGQGHGSAADLDAVGHYGLRDDYASLAHQRSLQDVRDPSGSQ